MAPTSTSPKQNGNNRWLTINTENSKLQHCCSNNASIYWTTSVNADISSLNEVYIPYQLWLTVFKDDFLGFF